MKKILVILILLLGVMGCGKEEFSIEKDLTNRILYLIPEEAQKELQIQPVEVLEDRIIINREYKFVGNSPEDCFKKNILLGLDDFSDINLSMEKNSEKYNKIKELEINYYFKFTETNKYLKAFGYTVKKDDVENISIDKTTLKQFANIVYNIKGEFENKYLFNSYKY